MKNPQRKLTLANEVVGDGLAVFDPQQQQCHVLNATSALVFQHCDGQTTPQQLAELLRQKFNLPHSQVEQLLWLTLDELEKANLLQTRVVTTQAPRPMLTRRQVLTAFGAAGLSLALIPIVSSERIVQAQFSTVPTTTPSPSNQPPVVGDISAPLDPQPVDSEISASANFSDPNTGDTHTATWDWGDDSTSPGSISGGNATGSHAYSTPGVYTITLTITDNGGLAGQSVFQYVVVYDPSGGFVTGGGWIDSPAGAYAPDPALTGKASFGFNSKYKPGQSTPSGNTEFQFKVADLNFKSSSYDWLVVAGTKAKFKGVGTINGGGSYGFMLTAQDDSPDAFRIKIWDKDNGDLVVYDNQMGESDDSDAGTALGGGSIVVHK